MKKILNKTQFTSLLIVLIIIAITFFTFYSPLKDRLEKSYSENFKILADLRFTSIENFIDRSLESSLALSSRTMIRNKMYEYQSDNISLDELKEYTQPRYDDGATVLKNLIGSIRVINDNVIAGHKDWSKIKKYNPEAPFKISYDIGLEDNNFKLIVYSPITYKDKVLGYDLGYFDMKNHIDTMKKESMNIDIVSDHFINQNFSGGVTSLSGSRAMAIDISDRIGYFYRIGDTDTYLYTYALKEDLFKPVNRITMISLISFISGLLILFVLLNFVFMRNSNRIISSIKESRDKYKDYAYRDALTGVNSRMFLKTWIEKELISIENIDKNYCLAMIDIDDFKEANDKYGHDIGDMILKEIAQTFRKSVRDYDIIIRYGGDEFLIIFENCNIKTAKSVIGRVSQILRDSNNMDIHFSYGVSDIKDNSKVEFDRALKKADDNMYSIKKYNKSTASNKDI